MTSGSTSYISGSTVTAADSVKLTADESAVIWSLTVAGAGGGAGGAGGGLVGSAAASGSVNTVSNRVKAYVTNDAAERSNITTITGDVSLSAEDHTSIIANAGAVSAAGAGGAAGGVPSTPS